MSTWSEFLLRTELIAEFIIRVVMLTVVVQRRRPASAMAWLLIIFFQPFVGLVLYLLIGENRMHTRRVREHKKLMQKIRSIGQRFSNHPRIVHPEVGPQAAGSVKLAERLSFLPILDGNAVEMLTNTSQCIDRLVADIDAAKKHVHLLFYIFIPDETGMRVVEALKRAAARGVTCRVLADAVGSRKLFRQKGDEIRAAGIQLVEALPVGLFRRRVARWDMRNHRKLAIVDGRIGYTGSQNIVDANYGTKDLAWHDLMVRITGPVLIELQVIFMEDWYFDSDEILDSPDIFPEPQLTGDVAIQTLPSGPNYAEENYQLLVVSAIHASQSHVIITTPYFIPDDALLQAMHTAVLRGVKVELIVPRVCDQVTVGAASRAYFQDVLAMGVKLHCHGKGLLHSKTVTIDESLALIGSSNFDIRSFALNFELNLLFYGAEVTGKLRAIQQQYLLDSEQVTLEAWSKRPLYKRVFDNICKLFSPLL